MQNCLFTLKALSNYKQILNNNFELFMHALIMDGIHRLMIRNSWAMWLQDREASSELFRRSGIKEFSVVRTILRCAHN